MVPLTAVDEHRQTTHLVAPSAAALPVQRTLSAVGYGQDSQPRRQLNKIDRVWKPAHENTLYAKCRFNARWRAQVRFVSGSSLDSFLERGQKFNTELGPLLTVATCGSESLFARLPRKSNRLAHPCVDAARNSARTVSQAMSSSGLARSP
jgi:hypothetical protein